MTERLEELVWAELDGQLSAAEARELLELRGRMGANRQDREAEVRRLAAGLARLEDLPAPTGLKQQILGRLEQRSDLASRPRHDSPSPAPSAAWYPRPGSRAVQWGLLAAGLAIAAMLVYQLALGPGLAPERAAEVVGTIKSQPGSEPPSAGLPGGLPDFVRLTARDQRLEATLSPPGGSFVFVFSAANLTLARLEFHGGATGTHQADPGRLLLEVEGPGRAELSFAKLEPAASVTLSVSGTAGERFEGTFLLDQLSQR